MPTKKKQSKQQSHADRGTRDASGSPATGIPETQLWQAIRHNDVEAIRELLFDAVESIDDGGVFYSPKSGAKAALARWNAKKDLPLTFAVANGLDEEGLLLLLRAGANVNAKDQTKEECTALNAACWGEDEALVQFLLRCGADIRITDSAGRTPLHVLASSNAHLLTEYVLDTISTTQSRLPGVLYHDGHPPLLINTIELLGKRDHITGATPLHTALESSSAVAGALLDHIETKLAEAQESNDTECERRIRENIIDACTDANENALHVMFATSANWDARVLEGFVDRLLKLGVDSRATNAEGQMPIAVACERVTASSSTSVELFKKLLTATIEAAEASSISPDSSAAEVDAIFCQHDAKGYGLIHTAVSQRNTHAVEAMIKVAQNHGGADATACRRWLGDMKTRDGASTTELLAIRDAAEIAKMLSAASAMDGAEYVDLKRRHEQLQAEATAAQSEEESEDSENEKADGDGKKHGSSGGDYMGTGSGGRRVTPIPGSTGSGGSRMQQARKARATKAAATRQRFAEKRQGEVDNKGGGIFDREVSLTMKILGAVLLLSMLVSVYALTQDGSSRHH